MGDVSSARDYRRRRRILVLNGATIVGCTLFVIFANGGMSWSGSSQALLLYCLSLGLLVVGQSLAWRERYATAALAMLLGGIGTLPIGLLAIVGSLASCRLGRRLSAPDPLKIPCSQCGYDLRGAPAPRCPECGCLRGFDKTADELGIELPECSTDRAERGEG